MAVSLHDEGWVSIKIHTLGLFKTIGIPARSSEVGGVDKLSKVAKWRT